MVKTSLLITALFLASLCATPAHAKDLKLCAPGVFDWPSKMACYEDAVFGNILGRIGPNRYEAEANGEHFIVNTKRTKFLGTGFFKLCVPGGRFQPRDGWFGPNSKAKKVNLQLKNGFVEQWWSYSEETRRCSVKETLPTNLSPGRPVTETMNCPPDKSYASLFLLAGPFERLDHSVGRRH
jgi:hypothetical protein